MTTFSYPGRGRRQTALRIGAALASAAATLASGACVSAVTYNPGHVPAAAMRRIVDACAAVARLPNGSVYDLDVCEESLSRSLAARLAGGPGPGVTPAALTAGPDANRRDREARACAAIGLGPADGGFGQCVADLDAELWAADRPIM